MSKRGRAFTANSKETDRPEEKAITQDRRRIKEPVFLSIFERYKFVNTAVTLAWHLSVCGAGMFEYYVLHQCEILKRIQSSHFIRNRYFVRPVKFKTLEFIVSMQRVLILHLWLISGWIFFGGLTVSHHSSVSEVFQNKQYYCASNTRMRNISMKKYPPDK